MVEKGHSCHCVDRLEGKATMEVCNGSLQWKSAMEVVCGESHDHVIEQEQTYQINLQCYGPAYRPLGVGVVINYGGPSNLVIVGRCDKQEKMGYVVVKDIAKLESYQCMSTFCQVTRHLKNSLDEEVRLQNLSQDTALQILRTWHIRSTSQNMHPPTLLVAYQPK